MRMDATSDFETGGHQLRSTHRYLCEDTDLQARKDRDAHRYLFEPGTGSFAPDFRTVDGDIETLAPEISMGGSMSRRYNIDVFEVGYRSDTSTARSKGERPDGCGVHNRGRNADGSGYRCRRREGSWKEQVGPTQWFVIQTCTQHLSTSSHGGSVHLTLLARVLARANCLAGKCSSQKTPCHPGDPQILQLCQADCTPCMQGNHSIGLPVQ